MKRRAGRKASYKKRKKIKTSGNQKKWGWNTKRKDSHTAEMKMNKCTTRGRGKDTI
jgi:hypothetical protein